MKYAIVTCINGNYAIQSEGYTTTEAAKVTYFGLCQSLWNAPDILTAYAMIVDEQLDCVDGYKEFIHHTAE